MKWHFVNYSKRYVILFVLLIKGHLLYSQKADWSAGLFSFFDNAEFGKSAVKIPQTMAGVMVIPEVGLKWDSVHRIAAGVNLMHEFGSTKAIDKFYPTAYYSYNGKPLRFLMGAFPRSMAVEKYPRLFFQDSVSYYRPNINGMFLEYRNEQNYVNVWLDWTGRQAAAVHEAFFIGMSGRYNMGIFNFQHYGYYFHFASRKDPVINEALHDNALFLTSAGIDVSGRFFPGVLYVDAGWVAGFERARADNTGWIFRNGLLVEMKAEYRFAGLYNTFYSGSRLMQFYSTHGNDLYWGDPVYRASRSDRADIYINLVKNSKVRLELTYSLHFLEGRVYNEQMLKVKINLDGKIKS